MTYEHGDLMRAIIDEGSEVPCMTWPDLFFPELGESTVRAKKLCGSCPVKLQCLEYALDAGESIGVWGGTSPKERWRLKNAGS